jgi:hypothetical protein
MSNIHTSEELLEKEYGIKPLYCCNLVCKNIRDKECIEIENIRPINCLYRMVEKPPNPLNYSGYMLSHQKTLDILKKYNLLNKKKGDIMNLLSAIKLLHDQIKQKEDNAYDEIKSLQNKIDQINKKLNAETSPLRVALAELEKSNTACKKCNATGKVRVCIGYDGHRNEYENQECQNCDGTGEI